MLLQRLTLFVVLFGVINGFSQSISDCNGAVQLCGDIYSETQATLNTGDVYEFTGTCNQSLETSSVWYTFTTQSTGDLAFVITPNNLNDDYDWGLFDITNGGCASIQDGTAIEVSCNSWGTISPPNGATGVSTANGGSGNSNGPGDLNGPPFNGNIAVQPGQVFALVVMNWSNSTDGYSIDFGESTAALYDDVPPSITNIEVNCEGTQATITFSEAVLTGSIDPSHFTISGPGGAVNVTSASVPNPGTITHDVVITFDPITTEGNYQFVATSLEGAVQDACSNPASGALEVWIWPYLQFDVNTTTACNGINGSLTVLNLDGGQAPFSYNIDGQNNPDPITSGLAEGQHTLTVTDGAGCVRDTLIVVPNQDIQLIIPLQDTLDCFHPSISVEGVQVIPDQSVIFNWQAASSSAVVSANGDQASGTLSGEGLYTLTVTNALNGCNTSSTIEIEKGEDAVFSFSLLTYPNVLTLNRDGQNDSWKPIVVGNPDLNILSVVKNYKLSIYNRWGAKIFDSEGTATAWTPQDLNDGVYYYTLTFESLCGPAQSVSTSGNIQLLR